MKKAIRMGFPRTEAKHFAKAVQALEANIDQLVSTVDVTKAQATVDSDLMMIQSKIKATVGQEGFNITIRTKLMAYLAYSTVNV